MWWIVGTCLCAGLLGLELRRLLRDRSAERSGTRRYARPASNTPDRALAIVEFGTGGTESADEEICFATAQDDGRQARRALQDSLARYTNS